jgi:hypothetical protein
MPTVLLSKMNTPASTSINSSPPITVPNSIQKVDGESSCSSAIGCQEDAIVVAYTPKLLVSPSPTKKENTKYEPQLTVLAHEATIVSDGNHLDNTWRKNRLCCASIGLILLLVTVITGATTVAMMNSNSNRSITSIGLNSQGAGLLGDWVECTDSLQCSNGCCSSTFSQGVYTCTPLDGGYKPSTCIGESEEANSLGDWEECTNSLQCSDGCCSSTFSQGVYKCTPLDGGYLPGTCIGESDEEKSLGDWVQCNSSLQCTDGCCSSTYSEGVFKCTPLIGGYLGDPGICINHAEESNGWEECTISEDCSTGCCSSMYSEGVLRCTPLLGGYRNDTCVGEE